MNDEHVGVEFYTYLALWLVAPVLLFALHARGRRLPGVLLYAYIIGFFINHWMGALVHASPWSQFEDSTDTISGFRLSTFALVALLIGAIVVPQQRLTIGSRLFSSRILNPEQATLTARILLVVGSLFWILTFSRVAALPSAASVLSAGQQSVLLGVCLQCWIAWQRADYLKFWLWMVFAFILPVLTVLTQGFIGYGIVMLGTVLMFVSMFYRPRWHLLVGLLGGIYLGMSLWVAYANHRNEIRGAVWGSQSFDARIDATLRMISAISPFNFADQTHLDLIDIRLNQNSLVGVAARTTPHFVPYANGETIVSAVVAVVPRALWPSKPVVGGSGQYVAHHTMMEFAEGTSVGMGQVLELYINFGVTSVLIGFFCLGLILRKLDLALVRSINIGDFKSLQFYFLVGAGALQAGGALSELVASMAGGAVLSVAISRYLTHRLRGGKMVYRRI